MATAKTPSSLSHQLATKKLPRRPRQEETRSDFALEGAAEEEATGVDWSRQPVPPSPEMHQAAT